MAQRWMQYGLGLDMSKDHIHACLGGHTQEQEFKVIAQRRFVNAEKGYEELVNWLEKHRKDKALNLQIVLEVTGVYHEGALNHLHGLGYAVCLELAKRVKRYLQSIGHKSKNDKLDGRGLAQMACERKLARWKPVSEQIYAIRALLRHRKALIVAREQFGNQLHALEHASVQEPSVRGSLEQIIGQLNKQVVQIQDQAESLAKKDAAFYAKVYQIADSVKGLGLISVLSVVAETNGFEEFASIKQLVSYAGYDVVENSSGKFTGKTRISKLGNARIRAALYMPALCVVRCKAEPFYSLYMRLLVRNGGVKMKANVAVQRKLLVLIYTLWKKNERFDEKHYSNTKEEKQLLQNEVAPA